VCVYGRARVYTKCARARNTAGKRVRIITITMIIIIIIIYNGGFAVVATMVAGYVHV